MKHIFVEQSYGGEAACFYEFVFGAKVMSSATERINGTTTRIVSTQLQFSSNCCIIISERNPNSSLCPPGVEIPTNNIWLNMKNIDPVVTRAKKLGIVFKDGDFTTTDGYWRSVMITDPYGISWIVHSGPATKGDDEIEDKEDAEVTLWEKQQHIYVQAPIVHKAIEFYKKVFGAEEVNREKASSSLVTFELNFGRKSIIVSVGESDHDSSLSSRTKDYIYLEVENFLTAMTAATSLGAQCDIVNTDIGWLTEIFDPYGNIWMIRSYVKG